MPEGLVTIVNYGMGNVGSLINMIKRVGGESILSDDCETVASAKKILLPGVGNFEAGMIQLRTSGLDKALEAARANGATIFGVCLGMQLLTMGSEESSQPGLGWFDLETRKFSNTCSAGGVVRVPHMGWNLATLKKSNRVDNPYVGDGRYYFVHSYYVDAAESEDCLATTEYGGVVFASSIGNANVQGVQFHPEKSHKFGMTLFERFLGG